jgi:bacterioferritin-associated ferredoxin
MIVCSCFGTTDREVRAAFGPQGDGQCPAGQACGGCRPMLGEIVAQARAGAPERDPRPCDRRPAQART